jgi:FtsZ-interacting cell division protein ZipA
MDMQLMWIIAAAAVVAVLVVALLVMRGRRSARLRQRFGPEYERTLRDEGDLRKAEAALSARAARVERLHIRPLSPDDAQRFSERWRLAQAQFVDDPKVAVTEADRLVGEVMHARGYPVGEFEQRVEDISVDHPNVVMNYRAARAIAESHARGEATTEDLRQAMVHYRALYGDLLGQTPAQVESVVERRMAAGRGGR